MLEPFALNLRPGRALGAGLFALALGAAAAGVLASARVAEQWGGPAALAVAAALAALALASLRSAWRGRHPARLEVAATGEALLRSGATPGPGLPVRLVALRMGGSLALLGLAPTGGDAVRPRAPAADPMVIHPVTPRGANCAHYLSDVRANDARSWHRLRVWALWQARGGAADGGGAASDARRRPGRANA